MQLKFNCYQVYEDATAGIRDTDKTATLCFNEAEPLLRTGRLQPA